MRSLFLAVFTLCAALATTQAARAERTTQSAKAKVLDPCLESATSIYEMGECLKAEGRRYNRRLRQLRSSLERVLSDVEGKAFERAHAQWRREHRARCRAEASDFEGGSLLPIAYVGCLNQALSLRITQYTALERSRRRPAVSALGNARTGS